MDNKFKACLICGNSKLTQVYPKKYPDLVKCSKCYFVFFKSKPTNYELQKHYERYSRDEKISKITIKRYNELLNQFETYRSNNNILEVGCGNGHFLKEAKIRNWNTFGTEFTENAVEICRKKGLFIHQGELDVVNYKTESFDCIIFIEVIEHINNPIEEVLKFSKLLRTGGVLYITTPNFNSFASRFLKEKWTCVEYPEHLTYYTPKTLDQLLTKSGFMKKELQTTGFNISSIKSKSQINGNMGDINEPYRELTEQKILFSALKKTINFVLNFTKTGDTIKAIYLKN